MAKGKQEAAFVLSEETAHDRGYTGAGPFHFAGFPGMWSIGAPIASSALGFDTVADAEQRISELGLPLTRTLADVGKATMPARPGHVPSQAQAAATGWTPGPEDPGRELAEGESFPPARDPSPDISTDFTAIPPTPTDAAPGETPDAAQTAGDQETVDHAERAGAPASPGGDG
jgi:hypothetical protein